MWFDKTLQLLVIFKPFVLEIYIVKNLVYSFVGAESENLTLLFVGVLIKTFLFVGVLIKTFLFEGVLIKTFHYRF